METAKNIGTTILYIISMSACGICILFGCVRILQTILAMIIDLKRHYEYKRSKEFVKAKVCEEVNENYKHTKDYVFVAYDIGDGTVMCRQFMTHKKYQPGDEVTLHMKGDKILRESAMTDFLSHAGLLCILIPVVIISAYAIFHTVP